MKDIAIIGAGIAGASAAFWLKRAGFGVRLFEASDRIGGCMGSHRRCGFTVERGPHLFMDSDGALARLANDLGISDELVEPPSLAARRFVLHDGDLELIPSDPRTLFATQALSAGGKLRAAVEPLIPARDDIDESVADLVRRRFGNEVLDYLVDPFISATQLGKPEDLSTRYVMRGLGELERKHGSVVVGGIRSRDKSGGERPKSVAFERGSWVLLETLERELADVLRLNSPVRNIRKKSDGYEITYREGGVEWADDFDEVILAVPAWALADIDFDLDTSRPGVAKAGETPYAPAALVSLGFDADEVEHPLDGFGVLVPSREERRMLATIFTSSVFPSRAPEGKVLLTSILGGTRRPFDLKLDDEVLVRRTLRELSDILGIYAPPVFMHVERQPRALAQCNADHHQRMTALDKALDGVEGLWMISNFRGKSSVPWLVSQAEQTSNQVAGRASTSEQQAAT